MPTMLRRRIFGKSSVRDLFLDVVDEYSMSIDKHWFDVLSNPELADHLEGRDETAWRSMDNAQRARWLIGQLWICSSILPSTQRRDIKDNFSLDDEPWTYAAAVRVLHEDLP